MSDNYADEMHDLTITPEQAVVAAIMLDSKVLRFAVPEVDWKDFGDTRLGVIFRGMTLMVGEREPIDVLTVSSKLLEWEVRGITAADLHAWVAAVPTAQNVEHYAGIVRRQALRRALNGVAVKLAQESQQRDPGWALSNAAEALTVLRDGHAPASSSAMLLSEILAGEDHYDWVIPDLLERRDRMMLTGSEGGGKTTFVRQLAILAAAGVHPMTFTSMPPARVLVVDAENSVVQWRRQARGLVDQVRTKMNSVDPRDTMVVDCRKSVDLSKDRDLGSIHKLIDDVTPDILFIGPLYRLTSGAITTDDDAAPVLAALDTFRDRGLALVIEAHAGHGRETGGDRDLRPRGSSALMGWPEFGMGLRPHKAIRPGTPAEKEFELVRWRGDRDARKWPWLIARGQDSGFPWTPTYPGGTR